jgi:hypothetical protein
MRGDRGSDGQVIIDQLMPFAEQLSQRLGATFEGNNGHFLWKRSGISYHDTDRWPEAIDWMEQTRKSYEQAISEIVTESEQ